MELISATASMLGMPVWWLLAGPLAVGIVGTLWLGAPRLRRSTGFRLAVILSVGIAGIELLIVTLIAGFLVLLSASHFQFQ